MRRITRSVRNIAEALQEEGFGRTAQAFRVFLSQLGYLLHVNQKMKQTGQEPPDRDEQFKLINGRPAAFMATEDPVISISGRMQQTEHSGASAVLADPQELAGRPLESLKTVVSLIGPGTTEAGLPVQCAGDPEACEGTIKVCDEEMDGPHCCDLNSTAGGILF